MQEMHMQHYCSRNSFIIPPCTRNEKYVVNKSAQSINNYYETILRKITHKVHKPQSVCLSLEEDAAASDGDFGGRMSCVYMSVSV